MKPLGQRAGIHASIVTSALTLLLTGCSTEPQACPEYAWFNKADVHLTGSPGDLETVRSVELCGDFGCTTGRSTSGVQPPYSASKVTTSEWQVSLLMVAPATATVTAYDTDNNIVGETSVALTWARTGGTERCGGPETADPLELQVTS